MAKQHQGGFVLGDGLGRQNTNKLDKTNKTLQLYKIIGRFGRLDMTDR